MRLPFLSLFMTSPFDGLFEHAEKVKECAWKFQQAIECHFSNDCKSFSEFREEVVKLEHEADSIKRRIRGHLPKGAIMPVDKFQLFMYIREQDHVLDSVKDSLDLISFRTEPGIPEELGKDFAIFIDSVIEPIEKLTLMVSEAKKYFDTFSNKQREIVKDVIHGLRMAEHEADGIEDMIKEKILNMQTDPVTVFQTFRVVEAIGSIADHAENAGDMMRAMIAR